MVQSVETVFDPGLDALVREEWALLMEAGLPSQARHAGPSNAPHVTLGVAGSVTDEAEEALRGVGFGAGAPLTLGGFVVFGGRSSVLSRLVVPTSGLLRTHAAVQEAWVDLPGVPANLAVGRWTPHVTLARRLTPDQLAEALRVLSGRPPELVGQVRSLRRWDADARETWSVDARERRAAT